MRGVAGWTRGHAQDEGNKVLLHSAGDWILRVLG